MTSISTQDIQVRVFRVIRADLPQLKARVGL